MQGRRASEDVYCRHGWPRQQLPGEIVQAVRSRHHGSGPAKVQERAVTGPCLGRRVFGPAHDDPGFAAGRRGHANVHLTGWAVLKVVVPVHTRGDRRIGAEHGACALTDEAHRLPDRFQPV